MRTIAISQPGVDVRTATDAQLTLNTKYPFAKLDSTNKVSFQAITLSFAHEPPNPNGTSVFMQRTQVYQFKHGYNYVPASWFLVSVDGFATSIGSEGVYLQGGGGLPANSSSVLIATTDATNVTFYIDKYYTAGAGITAPILIGTVANIRCYIFVNDLSGKDIPPTA